MYVIYAYSEARDFAFLGAFLTLQKRPKVGKHCVIGCNGISVAGRYHAVAAWRLQNPTGVNELVLQCKSILGGRTRRFILRVLIPPYVAVQNYVGGFYSL